MRSPSTWPPDVVCHLPSSAGADARRASPAPATRSGGGSVTTPSATSASPRSLDLFNRDHTTIKAGIEAHAQRLAAAATSEAASASSGPHAMAILARDADGRENACRVGRGGSPPRPPTDPDVRD